MAQAFTREPQIQSPSDNPLIFEFYEDSNSTNVNTSQFFYAIEVYVEGVLIGNYKTTVEVIDGTRGYSKFDASPIIQSQVANNYRITTGAEAAPIVSYYITFTPEYTQSGTDYTGATTTSSTRYAFKSKLKKSDWLDFLDGNLFPNVRDNDTASLLEWTTQWPTATDNYYVATDEQVFLSTYAYGTNFQEVFIELFDINGASITTATWTFASVIADGINIDCGPQNIIDNTTITSANFSTCAYYTILAKDDTATPVTITETFTFYIDEECTKYENVRAYFLSKSGNVDAFTFKLVSRDNTTTRPTNYKQTWGQWVDAGAQMEFQHSIEQGGMTTTLVQTTSTITLNSDWLTEELQNFLVENMYESPLIAIEQNGVVSGAVIMGRTFEKKKRVNDKLIREEVTLMISQTDSSMRL